MKFKCPKCGCTELVKQKRVASCKKCGFLDRRIGYGWVEPKNERRSGTILDKIDWKG